MFKYEKVQVNNLSNFHSMFLMNFICHSKSTTDSETKLIFPHIIISAITHEALSITSLISPNIYKHMWFIVQLLHIS